VEEELEFLKKYAGRSPNAYLGRSPSSYRKSKLKRIASWRARKIRDDCDAHIGQRPHLPLEAIPKSFSQMKMKGLISLLRSCLAKGVREEKTGVYERAVLESAYYRIDRSDLEKEGFTPMDKAAYTLGMSRKAFDLLVSKNSEIFKQIGKYHEKWYIPRIFLLELKNNEQFYYIIAKYEMFAERILKTDGLRDRQFRDCTRFYGAPDDRVEGERNRRLAGLDGPILQLI
jgi:hypothetical protein